MLVSKRKEEEEKEEDKEGLYTGQLEEMMNLLLSDADRLKTKHSHVDFLGVFPFDYFPLDRFIPDHTTNSSPRTALCAIVNTDPSTEPGSHWVAFFSGDLGSLEFFDSYAMHPSAYEFCIPSRTKLCTGNTCLQSLTSNVCGYYCLLYLYLRSLIFYSSSEPPRSQQHRVLTSLSQMADSTHSRDHIIPKIIDYLIIKIISRLRLHSSLAPSFSIALLKPKSTLFNSTSLISKCVQTSSPHQHRKTSFLAPHHT